MKTQDLLLNWETQFDTARNEMTYKFDSGVTVTFNMHFGLAVVAKDGETIDSFDANDMLVNEWIGFLANTAKQAKNV